MLNPFLLLKRPLSRRVESNLRSWVPLGILAWMLLELPTLAGQEVSTQARARVDEHAQSRVPAWAADAIFYQLFPERFRNGDPSNDPTRESLEDADTVPENWEVTPWTRDWYARSDWERAIGDNFYEHGVFHRRLGGDLQGVIDRLDYLQDLGINCIYFNPVFYARSLHKYDGNSFHHVDPHFGPDPKGDLELISQETADPSTWAWTAADRLFLTMIGEAHARGIRVIIDGVFNHTGRDFFAFENIRRLQEKSPYVDWYAVKRFDDPTTDVDEFEYQCWWGVKTLPEFADSQDGKDLHPGPRDYVFAITRRWMDPNGDGDPSDGVDGWRLDVANEVPVAFWHDWNALVQELNPEAYTTAEIWDDATGYLVASGFSATMNYHGFAFLCKGLLVDGRLSGERFFQLVQERLMAHPQEVRNGLMNMIDSHDTDRVASMIVNARAERPYVNPERFDYDQGDRVSPRHFREYDVRRPTTDDRQVQRLVALFQMTFVGAPMIYYGTEAGMDGADDPDDRMPMVWEDLDYDPRRHDAYGKLMDPQPIGFDSELFNFYRELIRLRRGTVALRRGDLIPIHGDKDGPFVIFARSAGAETIVVAINRTREPKEFTTTTEDRGLPHDDRFDLLYSISADGEPEIDCGKAMTIKLAPMSGAVWSFQSEN
jgi:glycosidase